MSKSIAAALLALSVLAAAPAAQADIIQMTVQLTGAQEFPGPGDLDGSGTAVLWFDTSTNSVTWSIELLNVDPVTAAHIHMAPAGASGGVRVDFAGQLSGGPIVDDDVPLILADPTGWYVNVHNPAYPAGAVRGQLPGEAVVVDEPGTLALAALGLLALAFAAVRRRR